MPQYVALTYTPDVDWTDPEFAGEMEEWNEFGAGRRGPHPRRRRALPDRHRHHGADQGGKGGEVITTDGPYAETKEALTGFYLLECADLDEAIAWPRRSRRPGAVPSRSARSSSSGG